MQQGSRSVTDPIALDLLERMFTLDPEKRITVREVLEHPYLRGACDARSLPRLMTKEEHR